MKPEATLYQVYAVHYLDALEQARHVCRRDLSSSVQTGGSSNYGSSYKRLATEIT